jgi:hypothetical protein
MKSKEIGRTGVEFGHGFVDFEALANVKERLAGCQEE